MNSPADALSASIESAARVVMMFSEDLKGTDWLHRICPKANCAAWTIGHLILSARMLMTRAGATDFIALPEGFEARFARNDTAPGAADFGDTSILRPLFQQQHEQFAGFVRAANPELLNKPMEHPVFKTVGHMFAFAPVHIGTHAGQISFIRRSLGRAPIV